MGNFVLGLVAGLSFAAVGTLVAVRDPEVQKLLGLFPTELARPPQPAKCSPAPAAQTPAAPGGPVEVLFDARRRLGPAPRVSAPLAN